MAAPSWWAGQHKGPGQFVALPSRAGQHQHKQRDAQIVARNGDVPPEPEQQGMPFTGPQMGSVAPWFVIGEGDIGAWEEEQF